jgi:hypothetical protein
MAALPAFAARVAWPAAGSAELRRLRCPAAVVAAMDGASEAFQQLQAQAAAGSARQAEAAAGAPGLARRAALLARDCMDYSWEELHSGPWCARAASCCRC